MEGQGFGEVKITILSGHSNVGAEIPIRSTEAMIGRAPESIVLLDHPTVSARHARLSASGGVFQIEDLASTNGTAVNGLAITGPVALKSGDLIQVGEVHILFQQDLSVDTSATQVYGGGDQFNDLPAFGNDATQFDTPSLDVSGGEATQLDTPLADIQAGIAAAANAEEMPAGEQEGGEATQMFSQDDIDAASHEMSDAYGDTAEHTQLYEEPGTAPAPDYGQPVEPAFEPFTPGIDLMKEHEPVAAPAPAPVYEPVPAYTPSPSLPPAGSNASLVVAAAFTNLGALTSRTAELQREVQTVSQSLDHMAQLLTQAEHSRDAVQEQVAGLLGAIQGAVTQSSERANTYSVTEVLKNLDGLVSSPNDLALLVNVSRDAGRYASLIRLHEDLIERLRQIVADAHR